MRYGLLQRDDSVYASNFVDSVGRAGHGSIVVSNVKQAVKAVIRHIKRAKTRLTPITKIDRDNLVIFSAASVLLDGGCGGVGKKEMGHS